MAIKKSTDTEINNQPYIFDLGDEVIFHCGKATYNGKIACRTKRYPTQDLLTGEWSNSTYIYNIESESITMPGVIYHDIPEENIELYEKYKYAIGETVEFLDDHRIFRTGEIISRFVNCLNKRLYDIKTTDNPPSQVVYRGIDEICVRSINKQERKFNIGDDVLIKASYYMRKGLRTPQFMQRQLGKIIDILYGYCGSTGKNEVAYEVIVNRVTKEKHIVLERELEQVFNMKRALSKEIIGYKANKYNFDSMMTNFMDCCGVLGLAVNESATKNELQNHIDKIIEEYKKEQNMKNQNKHIQISLENMKEGKLGGRYGLAVQLEIDKVIFNNPATIIYWTTWTTKKFDKNGNPVLDEDGKPIYMQDKTIVKCAPGETFNKYNGFCAAVAKRLYGTNSNICRIINGAQDDSSKKTEKVIQKGAKQIAKMLDDKEHGRSCKYYTEKCGRKYTCKQVNDCNGIEKTRCKEFQKNESKKKSGGKSKK